MKATATRTGLDRLPARGREAAARPRVPDAFIPFFSAGGPPIQRKASCACGGGCPSCQEKEQGQVQAKLHVSHAGDASEREADAVAEQVMSIGTPRRAAGAGQKGGGGLRVSRRATAPAPRAASVPQSVHDVTRSSGEPLDASARSFMEPRFGRDLKHVRVHSDAKAAESAGEISARAYTVGNHIVFGAGEYAPSSAAGRQLLAHELTHVMQQTGGEPGGSHDGVVQRAPTISIAGENFVGPLAPSQRRAAKSCPIDCCRQNLGTLHAMPLFFSRGRTAIVPAGDPTATGIGAMLHFIAAGTQPAAGELCHCDDFRMIQILESNVPMDPRGNNRFVDNNNMAGHPFYGDAYLSGRGEHTIDPRFPDAGERIQTTESIYDIPFRDPAWLGTSDFSWMAETCVACIKNSGPDRILGCVTYGFTRHYNAAAHSFDPVVAVSPGCLYRPTSAFVDTLRTDPSTTSYDFNPAPNIIECFNPVDDVRPRGDTRIA